MSVHHYACADKVAVEILVEQYAAAVLGMHGKLPCMADVRELFVLFLGELHIFLFEGVRNGEVRVSRAAVKPRKGKYLVCFLRRCYTYTAHSGVELDMHRYLQTSLHSRLGKLPGVWNASDCKYVVLVKIFENQRNIAVTEKQYIALDPGRGKILSLPQIGYREVLYADVVHCKRAFRVAVTVGVCLYYCDNIAVSGVFPDDLYIVFQDVEIDFRPCSVIKILHVRSSMC